MRRCFVATVAALALAAPGVASARYEAPPQEATGPGAAVDVDVIGTVGPDFTITLTTPDGAPVRRLDPGTYTILVRDQSTVHNFHLFGPGVDRQTTVDGTGEETWTITLALGAYTYRCDPHRTTLIGDFTVGTGQAPRTAPRLFAKVGPRSQISLTTASGRRVRTLKAGSYRIVVRDLTRRDNFHLRGPGVNRRTGIRFLGSTTWLVGLGAGRVYRYFSDARPKTMRGTFRVAGASQAQRLVAAVGPGFTISLRTAGGKRVRTLRPGTYRIVVRDRSGVHNFHLRGPGVNRRTGVSFVGTTTWTLRLRKGVYSFVCNPHEGVMHGAFRVR